MSTQTQAQARRISPAQAAKAIGHGRDFVMALIRAKELPATDERSPGSVIPRYRIDPEELERWRAGRAVVGEDGEPAPAFRRVVVTGVLARRRARAKRKKRG